MDETHRLETDRLKLSLFASSDAEDLALFLARNRAHLLPWEPTRPLDVETPAYWSERIRIALEDARADRGYRWSVRLKEEARLVVGHISFSNIVRGPCQSANLGLAFAKDVEGKGLATEAARAVMAVGFGELGLHRIEVGHVPENVRSAALIKRLGFEPIGLARGYLQIGGTYRDHRLYQLLSEDFQRFSAFSGDH